MILSKVIVYSVFEIVKVCIKPSDGVLYKSK